MNNHNFTQVYNLSFYLLLNILESLFLVPDFGKYHESNKMYFVGGGDVFFKVKSFSIYKKLKKYLSCGTRHV